MKKIGLFFGGMSNEAEVSIMSAKNVIKNFDYNRYKLALIYWHKDGSFYHFKDISDIGKISKAKKISVFDFKKIIDIALPMTHGKYGEDGVLQSIFEWQKLKYCGCRVLSSALCMDKAVFKEVINGAGINQTGFYVINLADIDKNNLNKFIKELKNKLRLPIYVKPSNSGSSVGITKVKKYANLKFAIFEAKKHDSKIIIEEGLIDPREIEVAVLGNENLIVSDLGELILAKDFYSYDDKYVLGQTNTRIPAKLTMSQIINIKNLAASAYKLSDCKGFARVDFFISKGKIYLNEINTLPGFTDISMFPMLMKNMGMNYKDLINKIISLAY
ncbi:MAG: D-alanyl-alanine synthetase A [Candidatus Nomurabacteria bacterium GW2011_GWB1_37_5]|uniref:D-alanine--D-alanine ligase n=1 Tax=Candidatus Nomurabacteria bacterium GW2011_GWB1_37_5 TaxID=1618742 RepID=A0A0G0K5M7_9BACT|nr:MAG: D-alanyl-alanine synthetase A [Candidatus Nomurabacteria bacterium GW2011_GWB1_37_5]